MKENNTPILIPYEREVLENMFRKLLRDELKSLQLAPAADIFNVPGMTQKPLYKAWEVCQMLQISRQTLHSWTKEGILKAYKVKSRLFYLWADIEKLVIKQES